MNSWGIQNIQRERHEKKKGKGLYKMSHFNQSLQISLKQCILEKMF